MCGMTSFQEGVRAGFMDKAGSEQCVNNYLAIAVWATCHSQPSPAGRKGNSLSQEDLADREAVGPGSCQQG